MWAGARAAVGVVAELVDVHAAVGGGVVAGDVIGDGRRGGFGRLLKGDGSADFGVTAEDCDCTERKGVMLARVRICGRRGSGVRKGRVKVAPDSTELAGWGLRMSRRGVRSVEGRWCRCLHVADCMGACDWWDNM